MGCRCTDAVTRRGQWLGTYPVCRARDKLQLDEVGCQAARNGRASAREHRENAPCRHHRRLGAQTLCEATEHAPRQQGGRGTKAELVMRASPCARRTRGVLAQVVGQVEADLQRPSVPHEASTAAMKPVAKGGGRSGAL